MPDITWEYLDQQFKGVNKAIEELAISTKRSFDAVSIEFTEVKSDIKDIQNNIKDIQNDMKDVQNRLGRVERKVDKAFIDGLDRHEKWIKQIANKIGVTLEA